MQVCGVKGGASGLFAAAQEEELRANPLSSVTTIMCRCRARQAKLFTSPAAVSGGRIAIGRITAVRPTMYNADHRCVRLSWPHAKPCAMCTPGVSGRTQATGSRTSGSTAIGKNEPLKKYSGVATTVNTSESVCVYSVIAPQI